jgi:hypothetical protein
MLFRQRIKTVTHIVELPNFVQDRIRMHGVRGFPEGLTARSGTAESSWARTSETLVTREDGVNRPPVRHVLQTSTLLRRVYGRSM